MAITKKVTTRRCPVSGITKSSTVSVHGVFEFELAHMYKRIIETVKDLCPDPGGTLSLKEFHQIFKKEFPYHNLDKQQLKSFKVHLRQLLENVIDYMHKEEMDVVFVKEITVEERNENGFKTAIIID